MKNKLKLLLSESVESLRRFASHLIQSEPKYDGKTHKHCPECLGTGLEDVFQECEKCEGTGVVRKTYHEYVDSLPN